jgi:hypothetical protein
VTIGKSYTIASSREQNTEKVNIKLLGKFHLLSITTSGNALYTMHSLPYKMFATGMLRTAPKHDTSESKDGVWLVLAEPRRVTCAPDVAVFAAVSSHIARVVHACSTRDGRSYSAASAASAALRLYESAAAADNRMLRMKLTNLNPVAE